MNDSKLKLKWECESNKKLHEIMDNYSQLIEIMPFPIYHSMPNHKFNEYLKIRSQFVDKDHIQGVSLTNAIPFKTNLTEQSALFDVKRLLLIFTALDSCGINVVNLSLLDDAPLQISDIHNFILNISIANRIWVDDGE